MKTIQLLRKPAIAFRSMVPHCEQHKASGVKLQKNQSRAIMSLFLSHFRFYLVLSIDGIALCNPMKRMSEPFQKACEMQQSSTSIFPLHSIDPCLSFLAPLVPPFSHSSYAAQDLVSTLTFLPFPPLSPPPSPCQEITPPGAFWMGEMPGIASKFGEHSDFAGWNRRECAVDAGANYLQGDQEVRRR